jgi:hypothetical protein
MTTTNYYLKDLNHVYSLFRGFPYGNKGQTLFIDDEPSKVLTNSKYNGLFLEFFRGLKQKQSSIVGFSILLMPNIARVAFGKYSQ